jgi:hypothetical protein
LPLDVNKLSASCGSPIKPFGSFDFDADLGEIAAAMQRTKSSPITFA